MQTDFTTNPAHQRVERNCRRCGRQFLITPSRARDIKRGKFCNKACSGRAPASLSERLARHTSPPDQHGCSIWHGAVTTAGYGKIGIGPAGTGWAFAHRVAWKLSHGPIPNGLYVCHSCDRPACVAVEHLFLGTQADNITDAHRKGRMARGENQGGAKLTATDVLEIRQVYSEGGVTQASIACQYGVSRGTIGDVVRGKNWRHLL